MKLLDERQIKHHYIGTVRFDRLRFRTTERVLLKEIDQLRRKIAKQWKLRQQHIDTLNREIRSAVIGSGVDSSNPIKAAIPHSDHWRPTRTSSWMPLSRHAPRQGPVDWRAMRAACRMVSFGTAAPLIACLRYSTPSAPISVAGMLIDVREGLRKPLVM